MASLCAMLGCHTEIFIHAPTKKRLVARHQNLKTKRIRVTLEPNSQGSLVWKSGIG